MQQRMGSDGIRVPVPAGHSYRAGPDGRAVAIPPEHSWRSGPDGRCVAIPPGASWRAGQDGRLVPVPQGWSFRQGTDGRIVAIPPDHTWKAGRAGRLVPLRPGEPYWQDGDGHIHAGERDERIAAAIVKRKASPAVLDARPVDRRKPDCNWLAQHNRNVTSQIGQDGVIAKIFETIGTTSKACCEFGAWDGKKWSNTFTLIHDQGWDGYLIEGSSEKFARIAENHEHNPRAHAVNAWVSFQGEATIDKILAGMSAPRDLDLMVIDIDGNDYHIWDSMQEYRPRVVAVEYNPTIPNDVVFAQARDWKLRQGCSILALVELGKKKGYELISTQGDAFFVLKELFPLFDIRDNSLDALNFVGPRETKIFHGYDGTLWTAGNRRLGWGRNVTFDADALQIPRGYKPAPAVEPLD